MIDMGIGNFVPKIIVASLLALAGCGETSAVSTEAEFPGDEMVVETIETDVIAPEAFSITDKALWDGRPTFGGVWIAYPNIETPERVRITNPTNDKSVIGALYRRERDFPGPQIELSADAAAALGVVAGTPAELNIVALRRVEVEVDVPRSSIPQPMTVPLRRPGSVVVPEPPAEVAAPEAPEETPVVAVPTPPSAAETPAVAATPLPPIAPVVEAAEPVAPPVAQAADDPASSYVQVATMESTRRANELVTKLEIAGLSAEIRESKSGSKTLYRIIVGPATSPEALEIMLSTVRELGYKDAIPLR